VCFLGKSVSSPVVEDHLTLHNCLKITGSVLGKSARIQMLAVIPRHELRNEGWESCVAFVDQWSHNVGFQIRSM
jgi:hypothetical protein